MREEGFFQGHPQLAALSLLPEKSQRVLPIEQTRKLRPAGAEIQSTASGSEASILWRCGADLTCCLGFLGPHHTSCQKPLSSPDCCQSSGHF
jgi:hypothetical protein